jgi:hypothetical protein
VPHAGQRALPLGERITAAPIDILWASELLDADD